MFFCLGVGSLMLTSCGRDILFEQNQKIDDGSWSSKAPAVFEVSVADTLSGYDFYINVRNSGSYGYSNMYLFVVTRFPGGQVTRDTVECLMATPEGEWIGSGFGDLHDQSILFKRAVNFPQSGTYRFELIQAMREDPLEGVSDIGLRIQAMSNDQ
jgi:gliding motility-associated lipoprotein GldH